MLYFDHNATHPLSRVAREAWLDATERFPGNPSSPHRLGSRAEIAITEAREKLATWLGCAPQQIIWTSGATESNNAVLHHAAATGGTQAEAWISAIEHPSTLEAARHYFGERHTRLPVTPDGIVRVDHIAESLQQHRRPVLIGVMAANNETGVLQPWREVLALCRAHGVPFFTDAAQWIGRLPADGLGECDFVSGCGHKFGGPQGVGFLKVPPKFCPLIVGGPQEDRRRAGTENVAAILSMIAALEERVTTLSPPFLAARLAERTQFETGLLELMGDAQIIGYKTERLWNTVAVITPKLADSRQRWVVKLDKLSLAVSTGSACASGKEAPSHVLTAMGIPGELASRALRISSGWDTNSEQWNALEDAIRTAQEAS